MEMDLLCNYISTLYGSEFQYTEKVEKGFLTENHILESGNKKYFLKKYRFDNQERIAEVHAVKKFFGDMGIPIVLPIPTHQGDTFFFFEGGYYTIFPFITEKQLSRGELSREATISLGETLGRIHLAGKDATLPVKEKFSGIYTQKALEKIAAIRREIEKIEHPTEFDIRALQSIHTKEALVTANTVTEGDLHLPYDHLVHGDFLDHNVFFDDKDHVSHIFDLEKCEYAPRVFELFRCLMYSFLEEGTDKNHIDSAILFFQSYAHIYPIPEKEIRNGLMHFYLKTIHSTWVEGEHYIKQNSRTDCFLLPDTQRIHFLSTHLDDFTKRLIASVF